MCRTEALNGQEGHILKYALSPVNGTSSIWISDGNDAYLVKGSLQFPDKHPVWNPDGSKIAFLSNIANIFEPQRFGVFVMDSTGTNRKLLIKMDEDIISQCWSPDGDKIAFCTSHNIFSTKNDGTELISLIDEGLEYDIRHLDWSPDGSKILFNAYLFDGRASSELYTITLKSGEINKIMENEFIGSKAHWSPDGSKIVFSSYGNIFTMDHDGQNVRQLTSHLKGASGPTWSPEGLYILYGLEDLNGLSIIVIDNNGKFIKKLPQSNKEFSGWTDFDWKY